MDHPVLNIQTPQGAQKVPLADKPITIGRHADNVVVLTDTQASRFHCVIARATDGFIIRDLDSRNGTRLNGQPIKTARFNPGDVVMIGSTQIELTLPNGNKQPPGKQMAKSATATPHPPTSPPPHPMPPQPRKLKPTAAPAPILPDDPPDLSPASFMQPSSKEDALVEDIFAQADSGQPDLMADFGMASTGADDEKYLPVLAESLPDKAFEMEDISTVNARGQVVHPPINSLPKKAPPQGEAVIVLKYIILICCRGRATDIHLEPKNEDYQVRLRIDGQMIDVVRLTRQMGIKLAALVKIMCDIDVQFKDIIQEGHFTSHVPGRRVDYRVSFAPSMFGQKLVIRVLDTANTPLHVRDLHLPVWMLEDIQRVMQLDQGMILVTGPTGSGKTTTLYSVLRDIGTDRRNVLTIEDPVEIEIAGATQIPVNEDKGNSFANLLRSMLRQDPDVIMVGEIRDQETARIAMQAAMTGHLVLSTLHAKDTIGTIFRLLDLGADPYLVASSIQLVVAQRLARELCPYCKKGVKPTPQQIEKMSGLGKNLREIYIPAGCPKCLKTGYAGRRAFFEMLTTTDALREAIMHDPTPRVVEESLKGTRFARLHQTGHALVAQGVTAFDEIEKAVGRV